MLSIPNCQFISNRSLTNDECQIMKEAKDANLLSQESKQTRVNWQLNLCPSKSTTPVLKRILFQYLKVNLQS